MLELQPGRIVVWDHGRRNRRRRVYSDKQIHKHLWEPMVIHPSVRLRDIFRIVADNLDFWMIVLQEYAMPELVEEYHTICKKKTKQWVDTIHVKQYIESHQYELDEEPDCEVYTSVCGGKRGKDHYAVDFVNLEEIIDAKMRLKFEVEMEKHRPIKGKRTNTVFGSIGPSKTTREVIGTMNPYVIEVFKAIFWELTFHGTPKDRRSRWAEVNETMKRIKSGKEKLYPLKVSKSGKPYISKRLLKR